jgi:multidrug efflux pump subunit AcrA (membrane-fusion protein)
LPLETKPKEVGECKVKKNSGMRKVWIGFSITVLAVIFVTVLVLKNARADEPLTVTHLGKQKLKETFTTSGTLVSENQQTVYLQPERGDLKKILVKLGNKVKPGDNLVEYDNPGKRYVTSKITGTVVKAVDDLVSGRASSDPLVVVADLHHLKVETNISDFDILKVKKGQHVAVTTDALPGKRWMGEVERVGYLPDSTASSNAGNDDSQVNYPVDIKLGNSVPFKLGTKLVVEIFTSDKLVMGLPASAVVDKGNRSVVFVAKDGKSVEKEVKVGQRNDQVAEILAGLSPFDLVIDNPPKDMTSGMDVKIR